MEDIQNVINDQWGSKINNTMTINDFALLKVIGVGSYGKVMQVKKKDSGEVFALKMLKKEHIVKKNQVQHTKTERFVLVYFLIN